MRVRLVPELENSWAADGLTELHAQQKAIEDMWAAATIEDLKPILEKLIRANRYEW